MDSKCNISLLISIVLLNCLRTDYDITIIGELIFFCFHIQTKYSNLMVTFMLNIIGSYSFNRLFGYWFVWNGNGIFTCTLIYALFAWFILGSPGFNYK